MDRELEAKKLRQLFLAAERVPLSPPLGILAEVIRRHEARPVASEWRFFRKLRLPFSFGFQWAAVALAASVSGYYVTEYIHPGFFSKPTDTTSNPSIEQQSPAPVHGKGVWDHTRQSFLSSSSPSEDESKTISSSPAEEPKTTDSGKSFLQYFGIGTTPRPGDQPPSGTSARDRNTRSRPQDFSVSPFRNIQKPTPPEALLPPTRLEFFEIAPQQTALQWTWGSGTADFFMVEFALGSEPEIFSSFVMISGSELKTLVYPSAKIPQSEVMILFRVKTLRNGMTSAPSETASLDLREPVPTPPPTPLPPILPTITPAPTAVPQAKSSASSQATTSAAASSAGACPAADSWDAAIQVAQAVGGAMRYYHNSFSGQTCIDATSAPNFDRCDHRDCSKPWPADRWWGYNQDGFAFRNHCEKLKYYMSACAGYPSPVAIPGVFPFPTTCEVCSRFEFDLYNGDWDKCLNEAPTNWNCAILIRKKPNTKEGVKVHIITGNVQYCGGSPSCPEYP